MNSRKNLILLLLAIAAFSNGVITQYIEPGIMFPKTDIPFMLVGVFLSFWWYYLDSEQIEFQRGKLLNIGIIAIGFLAFPYYFFRSRGVKKGFVYTIAFIIVVISWSVLQSAGAHAVYYGIQS
jgi:hypothetical protein